MQRRYPGGCPQAVCALVDKELALIGELWLFSKLTVPDAPNDKS